MTWRIYLAETTTGAAGRALDPVSFSWADEVNAAGGGACTVKKAHLDGLARERYSPGWACLVACYVRADGTEVPWVGGPVTGWPTESREELTLNWAGMWSLFEHRTVERDLAYRTSTLGQIAWQLAQEGMAKPGGALPLVHGTPDETGTRERTYEAWNLANNQIAKRWKELSEVINGPDIMLRPRWADDHHTRFEWAMVHGTTAQPTIPQEWMPDWDTTPEHSDVEDITVTSDSSGLVSRVWATGAGEGAGTVVVQAQDLTRVQAGHPFTETVISDPEQGKSATLLEKAQGHLAAAQQPVDQVTLVVRADSTKNPLGRWWVGDAAWVTFGDQWLTVPAGTHLMRIIKASGNLTETVTLEFQTDQLGE